MLALDVIDAGYGRVEALWMYVTICVRGRVSGVVVLW